MVDLGSKTFDTVAVGDSLRIVGGVLTVATAVSTDILQYVVDKVYTMPDGQPGLKVRCVKAHA